MKLKVLSCTVFEKNYKINFEYIEGEHFYPDGKGGQLGDLGRVGNANILKVLEDALILDAPLELCDYDYSIDPIRRMDAMENHTGEHIFSAVAFFEYGWKTAGFRMAENYCTLDFDIDNVTDEMVLFLENRVNSEISKGHPIKEQILDHDSAKIILGERKGIPEKAIGSVRVLSTIPGDFNACAGLHLSNSKDVKLFKILSFEKIKSTYTRFYFVCGRKALSDYNFKHKTIMKLGNIFSCQPETLLSMIDKTLEEKKNIEKEKKELEIKYSQIILQNLISNPFINISQNEKTLSVFFIKENKEIIEYIKKDFSKYVKDFLLITNFQDTFSVSSNVVDCNKLFLNLKEQIDIKGGGNASNINFKSLESHDSIVNKITCLAKVM